MSNEILVQEKQVQSNVLKLVKTKWIKRQFEPVRLEELLTLLANFISNAAN